MPRPAGSNAEVSRGVADRSEEEDDVADQPAAVDQLDAERQALDLGGDLGPAEVAVQAFKRVCTHYIQSSAIPTLERLGLMDPDTDLPANVNLRHELLDPVGAPEPVLAAAATMP
ncbi:MAG TPA: hypothetical protein VIJ51_06245 [Solirubrobacteraceae bacterium]